MFGESREEREVRVDGEHAALTKTKLTGHQFEPLFKASIANSEGSDSAIRPESFTSPISGRCRRIFRRKLGVALGRSSQGWRPARPTDLGRVLVLEYEQREAAHRAISHSVYSAISSRKWSCRSVINRGWHWWCFESFPGRGSEAQRPCKAEESLLQRRRLWATRDSSERRQPR